MDRPALFIDRPALFIDRPALFIDRPLVAADAAREPRGGGGDRRLRRASERARHGIAAQGCSACKAALKAEKAAEKGAGKEASRIRTGTGLTPPAASALGLGSPPTTSATRSGAPRWRTLGLGSPITQLYRDWARPLPHLHWDYARSLIETGTAAGGQAY